MGLLACMQTLQLILTVHLHVTGTCNFLFILLTGTLNVSIQRNKRLASSKKIIKNKKNHFSVTEKAELPKHEENRPESTSTSVRPQNTTFYGATCKERDSENEVDDEMIADGKAYVKQCY